MATEKWIVHPGETRVIDVADISTLKASLASGQIDIIGHDEPGVRIEVHVVSGKDLRIDVTDDALEIDHPQLRWDNFLEVFKNFSQSGPRAEVSVAVPRDTQLTLGVVSASALVSGLAAKARLNTTSGDIIVDGHDGDVSVNSVSGDLQVRELTGAISVKTVSGDVTVSGELSSVNVDAVSGATYVDSVGAVGKASINSISGAATVRIDEGYAANYLARSVSGTVLIDGITRSGSGPTNWTGSVGELSSAFVDINIHTVSGAITVARRGHVVSAEDHDVQWPSRAPGADA